MIQNKMVSLSQIRHALTALALPETVSSEEAIRQAFTNAVKAAADGYGGYTGDMNALTTAKEVLLIALANVKEAARERRKREEMQAEMGRAGERLRAPLESSGLFRSVRTLPGHNVVILSLDLNAPLVFSDRVVRFCLNFLGESSNTDDRERTLGVWCGAWVEEVTERSCRIRIRCKHLVGWDGLSVIAELIMMATRLSQPAVLTAAVPHDRAVYRTADLTHVFQTKEEFFTCYEHFVTKVIANHDDLATLLCDSAPALHDLWLCCPKHRLLFAQRLMLNEALRHLLDPWQLEQEYADYTDQQYLDGHPSSSEMAQVIISLLAQELTPLTWFDCYYEHQGRLDSERWDRPTHHCLRRAHYAFQCCAFHQALNTIERLFNTWLVQFDTVYHLRQFYSAEGYPINLGSISGLALLAHEAQVDLDTFTIPPRYAHVLEVDVTTYHRREEVQA